MRILQIHVLLRCGSVLVAFAALALALDRFPLLIAGCLVAMAMLFGVAFIDRVEAGDRPAFERDRGGIGLDPDGWSLSPALAYLVAATIFAVAAAAAVAIVLVLGRPDRESESMRAGRGAHAAAPSANSAPTSKPPAASPPTTAPDHHPEPSKR